MAHPYEKFKAEKVAHQAAKSRVKGYDTGGNVKPLPMSPGQAASAIERLGKAGILDREAASDFVASRSKAWGVDPVKLIGRQPKYARGGKVGTKVNVNIINPPSRGGAGAPPPPLLPPAMGPAPGPATPMLPPGGGAPPMPLPPGGPPMKRGGRVKMTGGAASGVGRLQMAKRAK